jgi:hypothetical protein
MHTSIVSFHPDYVALSAFGFSVAALACAFGLFSANYRENWFQHIGMLMVGVASALKVHQTIERGFASAETAVLSLGIAIFCLGVAWKVRGYVRDDHLREKYGHHTRSPAK